ncbi:hypothetical protein GLN32_10025, partial [Shigella flexneri 2a]|nr:hypothetical protein [Shigella flexneri 2a]
CIGAALFGQISAASNCWSNHVGIIIGHSIEIDTNIRNSIKKLFFRSRNVYFYYAFLH